jgi:hypothetical protein
MGLVARVCQPSTLRILICPEASSAQNNIAAVSADGSTVWVDPPLEFLVQSLDCIGGAQTALLARWQARESESVRSFRPAGGKDQRRLAQQLVCHH